MAKKLASVESIMEQESKGFANRAAGMSENGIATDATNTVAVNEEIGIQEAVGAGTEATKKTGKVGRPKKDIKEKRGNRVMVYLNEEMYNDLINAAEKENISLNQVINYALRKYVGK